MSDSSTIFDAAGGFSASVWVNRNTTANQTILNKEGGVSGSYGWSLRFTSGAGYSYDLNDWAMLVKNIELMFKKDNIKPIIVTSRRTDKAHESYLYNKLAHLCSTDSIWFHKERTPLDLEKIFNKVSLIFVTEESATMTAEAISSGLPTSTLYPDKYNKKNEFYDHLIKYEKMRYIKRLNFKDNLSSHNYDSAISKTIIQIRSKLKKNILDKINI